MLPISPQALLLDTIVRDSPNSYLDQNSNIGLFTYGTTHLPLHQNFCWYLGCIYTLVETRYLQNKHVKGGESLGRLLDSMKNNSSFD